MKEKITIACPYCRTYLLRADKKDKNTREILCPSCDHTVIYNPNKGEIKFKRKIERKSISGVTYY